MTNKITVYGKEMAKGEFFDYVLEVFNACEFAIDDEAEKRLFGELRILRNLLHSYGWSEEYQNWLSAGAGVYVDNGKVFVSNLW